MKNSFTMLFNTCWLCIKSNQSILKEINPEYSPEGLLLKLKHQYFGHLMWRANSLEKTLLLGKIEGKRRREQQKMRWIDSIADSVGMNLSKLWKRVKEREAWRAAVRGVTESQTWLSEWTTMMKDMEAVRKLALWLYGEEPSRKGTASAKALRWVCGYCVQGH